MTSSSSNYVVKQYPLDLARMLKNNIIANEEHDLDSNYFPVIIPREGSFFNVDVKIYLDNKLMKYGIDYSFDAFNIDASRKAASSVYDAIVFRRNLKGKLSITYHVIGEPWVNRVSQVQRLYNQYLGDNRPVAWENITNKPDGFPCLDHKHYGWDIKDWGALTIAIMDATQALIKLHASCDARVNKMIQDIATNSENNIASLLGIINNCISQLGGIKQNINSLMTEFSILSDDFYAEKWVPETRMINGYALNSDITLNNRDVGAISSKYKDTFLYGFNDNLTNIGKQGSTTTKIFNTMKELYDLPVGYHGYVGTNTIIGMPTKFGWLHKLGYNNDATHAYYLFYEDNNPSHVWYCIPKNNDPYPIWRRSGGANAPGTISAYFGIIPPDTHAIISGQQFDIVENPQCYKLFPSGRFPDGRAVFLRGLDNGRGLDHEKNRAIGSYQEDKTQHITGVFSLTLHTIDYIYCEGPFYDTGFGAHGDEGVIKNTETRRYGFDNSLVARTATEETVKNIAVNWIIALG